MLNRSTMASLPVKDSSSVLQNHKVSAHIYKEPSRLVEFTWELMKIRAAGKYTDVTVDVNGNEFKCHRLILAASSPFFQALFKHDEKAKTSGQVCLPSLSPVGFEALLNYMYSDQVEITADNAIDILVTADYLGFESLVKFCASFLLQHINEGNCLRLQHVGQLHSCEALSRAAYQYAVDHFSAVIKEEEFPNITLQMLVNLLKARGLNMGSEYIIMDAIFKWMSSNQDLTDDSIQDLINCVNWSELTCNEVHSFIDSYRSEFPSPAVIKFMENALKLYEPSENLPQITRLKEIIVVVPRDTNPAHNQVRNMISYFDPNNSKWSDLTNLPFETMELFSVASLGNKIYITGGMDKTSHVECKNVWRYDIETNVWCEIQPMLKARYNHSSVSMGAHLFAVGGCRDSRSKHLRRDGEMYSLETEQWEMIKSPVDVSGIGRCALVPFEGRLYMLGGSQTYTTQYKTMGVSKQAYTAAQYYNPKQDEWSHDHSLSAELDRVGIKVGMGDCLTTDGLLIFLDDGPGKGKRHKVYNQITQKIEDFILVQGYHRFCGAVLTQGGKIVCTGGVESTLKAHDMVHQYDLHDSQPVWQVLPSLPHRLSHHTSLIMYKAESLHVQS